MEHTHPSVQPMHLPKFKLSAAGLYVSLDSFSLLSASVSFHLLESNIYSPLFCQYLMDQWAHNPCPTLSLIKFFQQQSFDTPSPNEPADLKRQNPDGFDLF